MTRTKVLLLIAFVLAFCAGTALGYYLRDFGRHHRGPTWLSGELNLTAEQEERISRLEAKEQDLSARLSRAETKIEKDNELLERARKARASGLGLLEDQKENQA